MFSNIGITSAAVPSLAKTNNQAGGGKDVAKNILEYVVAHISEFKKLNQDIMFQGVENEDDADVGSMHGGSDQMGKYQFDGMVVEGVGVSAVPRPL